MRLQEENNFDLDFYSKEPVSVRELVEADKVLEEWNNTEDNFDSIYEAAEALVLEILGESEIENELEKVYETIEGDTLIEEMVEELDLVENAPLTEEGFNHVNLSYQAKLKRVETQSAMILAKEANDILFSRYTKFNKLRLSLKKDIIQKYGPRAKGRARQVIAIRQNERDRKAARKNNSSAPKK